MKLATFGNSMAVIDCYIFFLFQIKSEIFCANIALSQKENILTSNFHWVSFVFTFLHCANMPKGTL